MSEEKMRAEFEAWCRQNNGIPARLDGTDQYIVEAIQAAWVAWKAATASKQREIAELSAQVEVMREACKATKRELIDDEDAWLSQSCVNKLDAALSITPSTALLAHDNEVAAKVLDAYLKSLRAIPSIGLSECQFGQLNLVAELEAERRNRK